MQGLHESKDKGAGTAELKISGDTISITLPEGMDPPRRIIVWDDRQNPTVYREA